MEKYTFKFWKGWAGCTGDEDIPRSGYESNLDLDSVQQAWDMVVLAGLVWWEIYKGKVEDNFIDWESRPVLISTPLIEYRKKANKEADDFHKAQRAKAEKINNMPEFFELNTNTAFDDVFVLRRSKYRYRPSYSKTLQGTIEFAFKNEDERKLRFNHPFWHTNYLTRAGAIKAKLFREEYASLFDFGHELTNSEIKEVVLNMKREFLRVRKLVLG